jgi:hypothetical protein
VTNDEFKTPELVEADTRGEVFAEVEAGVVSANDVNVIS